MKISLVTQQEGFSICTTWSLDTEAAKALVKTMGKRHPRSRGSYEYNNIVRPLRVSLRAKKETHRFYTKDLSTGNIANQVRQDLGSSIV